MSLQTEFKNKVLKPIAIGVVSMAAVFSPVAANENVSTVSVKNKAEQKEWKPSPIKGFKIDKLKTNYYDYIMEQSKNQSLLILTGHSNQSFHALAKAAKEIQKYAHEQEGLDVKVIAKKSKKPNVAAITLFSHQEEYRGNRKGVLSIDDALAQKKEIVKFFKEQRKPLIALTTSPQP